MQQLTSKNIILSIITDIIDLAAGITVVTHVMSEDYLTACLAFMVLVYLAYLEICGKIPAW